MPGEKGDVGGMVGDSAVLFFQHRKTSSVRIDGLICLSLFNRAALEILVLLVTVG